ncbi:unnamed protein product, partial [Discosporangium mesarthrocarpum]
MSLTHHSNVPQLRKRQRVRVVGKAGGQLMVHLGAWRRTKDATVNRCFCRDSDKSQRKPQCSWLVVKTLRPPAVGWRHAVLFAEVETVPVLVLCGGVITNLG